MGYDPTKTEGEYSSQERVAGTEFSKGELTGGNAIDDQNQPNDSHKEPTPPEVVRAWKLRTISAVNKWISLVQDPANSSAIIAVFTVVIAFSGIGYGVVATLQWLSMKDALALTRNAQRPWVGISQPITGTISFTGGNVAVHGTFGLKNFGSSPALKVYTLLALAITPVDIDDAASAACTEATRWFDLKDSDIRSATQNREFGNTIFPGQELQPSSFTSGTSRHDRLLPSRANTPSVELIGCIVYTDQFRTMRRTQFCWHAFAITDGDGYTPFFPCPVYNNAY